MWVHHAVCGFCFVFPDAARRQGHDSDGVLLGIATSSYGDSFDVAGSSRSEWEIVELRPPGRVHDARPRVEAVRADRGGSEFLRHSRFIVTP
jgi:hypothetical protein